MRKSNGHSVTYGGATVTDADTLALPDGRLVRAFVERIHEPQPVLYLYLPEDWAASSLAAFQVRGGGRLEGLRPGTEAPGAAGWTLADLRPADAAAWDGAVKRLGGEPWIPQDGMPSVGESTEELASSETRNDEA